MAVAWWLRGVEVGREDCRNFYCGGYNQRYVDSRDFRMMNRIFIEHIRRYVARYSVSASAARGQSAPGLVRRARAHLVSVPLRMFAVPTRRRFEAALDRETQRLQAALPPKGRSWGIARKLLNIYLRNAVYTSYLREYYGLAVAEAWYEIPLDAVAAKQIRAAAPGVRPPRWLGVRHLTLDLSSAYQNAARLIAAQHGVDPVHLDAWFWGGDRIPAT